MKDAVSALLDSLFAYTYPAHPLFEQEVRVAALRRVLEEVQRAAVQPDQRILVEDRSVRQLSGRAGGAAATRYSEPDPFPALQPLG